MTDILTRRAKPVKFSVKTGFRLCGIAEEPFCPLEKNSSASSTSVRCICLISIAIFSIELATTPNALKYAACLSRGMIWVLIVSGAIFNFLQTYSSTYGSMFAKVPTAPEMAPVETSERATNSRSLLRAISA